MENPEVEAVLKFYKDINLDIKTNQKILNEFEEEYNTLEGVVYDGLPHGGRLPDQTAVFAITIADTGTAMRIKMLKERIRELENLKTEILREVLSLPPVHKTIICSFYIENRKWEHIAEHVNYSIRQSKNIRRTALAFLGKKFEENKIISESKLIKKLI